MSLFFFFFFVGCFFVPLVKCDLPIHALMSDVYGTWRFRPTKKTNDIPETCGGGIPNNNEENLNLKHYESYLNKMYGDLDDIKLRLTIEKTKVINEWKPRNSWTFLAVRDYVTGDLIGHWSMVYDQGFEIRLKGRRYFGFFKYHKKVTGSCPQPLIDGFSENGKKICYMTDPTKIQIGWYIDETVNVVLNEKKMHWGCFYAEKEEDTRSFSYVIHDPDHLHMRLSDVEDAAMKDSDKSIFLVSAKRASYKKIRLMGLQENDATNANHENSNYACKKNDFGTLKIELNLPKHFTWGDPYTTDNFEDSIDDQRECGSCYAISSAFSLQKRFEIFFLKIYKKKINMPKLSYQSLLSCSPFNQSCGGGYPYLIGRHMYEFGITTEKCMKRPIEGSANVECKMDMGNFNKKKHNNDNNNKSKVQFCDEIYYASDYHYVGGCYECTSEFDMMNEILLNGPIIVAINAREDLLRYYNVDKNVIYINAAKENKICDLKNKGFNGWQYTNHAVNIVGWGEQEDENKQVVKYWIIRNTWGSKWGYKGYLKFQRGINLAGIESQAVYIDPDFTRGNAATLLKNR